MQPIPTSRALVPIKQHPNSTFSWQLAHELCEHIAEGGSLRNFCEQPGRPQKRTVLRWLREKEEFRTQYTRAREDQADHFFDEIQDIADDARNDWMDRQCGDETVRVVDHEAIARSRLRIDARKWAAGKMRPKVYGDKSETTHTLNATDAFVKMLQAVSPGGAKLRVVGGKAA